MFNKNSLINLFKGALIGVSMIIPGVSGGTVAVLLNIYNELIEAISNLKSEFKKSFKFLLPIAIGMVLAFVAMYFPLKLALKYIPLENIEEELINNINIYSDKHGITKEMLKVFEYYKSALDN